MLAVRNEIPMVLFPLFEKAGGVTAAVSSRKGGVSAAPFDSLNMSFSSGDAPLAVKENRRRFLSAAGILPEDAVSCHQVHGTHVEIVGKADCGRGALSGETAIAGCDGLLTAASGVPLTMNFADCTPIFLYDPVRRAAAVVHGGWRGTAGDIAGKTVRLMEETYGSRPSDILAGIGPAIRMCCFEVGEDVTEAFRRMFPEEDMAALCREKGEGKFLFDLAEANRRLLLRAGVRADHIEDSGLCTYCRDDLFFSYRKSGGRTGRHMGVIMLR